VWHCRAGAVVGWRDAGVLRATGIRYARAQRYAAPVPEPPAAEPIRATQWSPACPQPAVPLLEAVLGDAMAGLTYDEDCQRLSVTVPVGSGPDDALPVMVWIHGGSYTSGAGDAPIFDPAALVREQSVVVVSVTYRLGLLGYLGGPDGPPANLGLLDQLEALRWVRRNIAAFGGEPDAVTLFGQSAGADAVAHLMVADGAEGLFRRAVVQSAPLGLTRGRAPMTAAMARQASRVPVDAPVSDVVAAQAGVLRAARRFGVTAAMPFGVQYGHAPLPAEDEVDQRWRQAATQVDLLVGGTDRETALYIGAVPGMERVVGVPVLGRVVRRSVVARTTRRIYGDGTDAFVRRHAAGGGRGYRYLLSWGAETNPYAGAHTIDMPLLFGNRTAWEGTALLAGTAWDEVEEAGSSLRLLWAEFARSGTLPIVHVPGLIRVDPIVTARRATPRPTGPPWGSPSGCRSRGGRRS